VLPGIDGVELARRIVTRRPSTRVLFMSGYTNPPRPLPESAPPLLAKPFTGPTLLARVRQTLDS